MASGVSVKSASAEFSADIEDASSCFCTAVFGATTPSKGFM
jgi:hypothetical protein